MKEFKVTHSITERTPLLSAYMQDISRYPLLTLAEEEELTRLAQAGDQHAKQRLVECNLRFVISVAKPFIHQGVSLEDLIMEGNLGLINAIERFDPSRGFKLSTYAVWWIRQSILHALADKGRSVRLPMNQVGMLLRVRRAMQDFYQRNERYPLPEELADQLSLPVEKVQEIMENAATEFSIDAPMGDDEDMCYADTLVSYMPATDSGMLHESLCTDINRWLGIFDKDSERDQRQYEKAQRAKDIVIRSFGLNGTSIMTLDELALKHHITRERVRQIQQSALRRLRSHITRSSRA
jgi:RNA polymerase primary sigma factor